MQASGRRLWVWLVLYVCVRACVPGAPEKLRSTRLLCRKRRKTLLGEEDGMNLASIQGECE